MNDKKNVCVGNSSIKNKITLSQEVLFDLSIAFSAFPFILSLFFTRFNSINIIKLTQEIQHLLSLRTTLVGFLSIVTQTESNHYILVLCWRFFLWFWKQTSVHRAKYRIKFYDGEVRSAFIIMNIRVATFPAYILSTRILHCFFGDYMALLPFSWIKHYLSIRFMTIIRFSLPATKMQIEWENVSNCFDITRQNR